MAWTYLPTTVQLIAFINDARPSRICAEGTLTKARQVELPHLLQEELGGNFLPALTRAMGGTGTRPSCDIGTPE